MASFPPLYCFAANVAGPDATVRSLLIATGPHDFNPTPRDAQQLHRATVFFINGLGLDDLFAGRIRNNAGNPTLKLVALGEAIPPTQRIPLVGGHTHDHGHAHHHHHHGEHDPHVWLGIPEAIVMVERIGEELAQIDPKHADNYRRRAADYAERLRRLHAEGKRLLANKKERQLVSFHDSLRYFARSFDLTILDSIEPIAGQEPSPQQLAKLVEDCRRQQTRLIAVEPQYPTNTSAQSLLNELRKKGIEDAAFVEVDPLETAVPAELSPEWYETKMRENLLNLARALR
ncbi:MAG: metal ABC transporter substrate-binding protein [Gemmataceae bacterium]|nr:metal ABC transporter substrate-binding protein [Gemmataceae bacterium]MDW8265275.1 metal ABC transporter substrate-binding protein [Gemmataceae bacterium]